METDKSGILDHATRAGLYRIKAEGGDLSYTFLSSGAKELVVSIPIHVPGNVVEQDTPLIPNTGILHGFVRVPSAGRLFSFVSWRSGILDISISRHFPVDASVEVAAGGTWWNPPYELTPSPFVGTPPSPRP